MLTWLEYSSIAKSKIAIIDIVDEFSLAMSLRIKNGNYFISIYQFIIKKFFHKSLIVWLIIKYFSQLVPFIKNWGRSNNSSIKFSNKIVKNAI